METGEKPEMKKKGFVQQFLSIRILSLTGKFQFQNLKPKNINPTSQFDDSCLGCMLKN